MRKVKFAILILVVLFLPVFALGQTTDVGIIQTALEKNNEIQKAVADIRSAEAVVEKTYGIFDLKLDGTVSYTEMINDTSAGMFSAEEMGVYAYGLSLSEKLMTAGILSLEFSKSETMNTYSPDTQAVLASMGSVLNPTHQPELSLMYTQPLMKGFLGRPDLVAIKIGDMSIDLATESLINTVLQQVDQFENALLTIAMSQEILKLQENAFLSNERYYRQAQRMKKIGLREEKDLMQTKAAMLNAKAQIRPAQDSILSAKDAFYSMTGVVVSEDVLLPRFDPEEQKKKFKKLAIGSILTAEEEKKIIELQPAVRLSKISIEIAELNKKISKNSAWPELNVFGKYGLIGTEGDSGESFIELVSNEFHNYMFGLNFTLYLPNRDNSGDVKNKENELLKAEAAHTALIRNTQTQIRAAHRSLMTASGDFQIKKEIRQAYARNLTIHNRDFSQGRISARELLLAESDFQRAKLSEVQAYFTFEREINQWKKMSGLYHQFSQPFIKE